MAAFLVAAAVGYSLPSRVSLSSVTPRVATHPLACATSRRQVVAGAGAAAATVITPLAASAEGYP